MGAICGKVETQGESRKEVEEDLRIDNRKRNSLIFAVIEWVSAVDANNSVKDQEKLATIIVRDSASFSHVFRTSSCVDGVFMIIRESTRLVRQCRDAVVRRRS